MGPKRPKKIYNIRLDEEMAFEISKRSEEQQITDSETIRRLLKKALDEKDDQLNNINKLLVTSIISNLNLGDILRNVITDPSKLIKSIEKIKSDMRDLTLKYGVEK